MSENFNIILSIASEREVVMKKRFQEKDRSVQGLVSQIHELVLGCR